MDYQENVPRTAISRERLARMVVHDGLTICAAAARLSISAKTATKRVAVIGIRELLALPIAARARITARGRQVLY